MESCRKSRRAFQGLRDRLMCHIEQYNILVHDLPAPGKSEVYGYPAEELQNPGRGNIGDQGAGELLIDC